MFGGAYTTPAASLGLGAAGGGNGSAGTGNLLDASSALANTGSGGGGVGGAGSTNAGAGGAGGSGIVVLRYPSYLAPASSTTGSPQTYIAGAYRVYVFTSSGSITF
jgi:hypothetical protein